MDKKAILFLCTGNSCRSQMAEGFAKKILSDNWEVLSAGIVATGLNPTAVKVMKEKGIDISNQKSKSIEELGGFSPDIVITLCDNAKESCPVYPAKVRREHWSLFDPTLAAGPEEIVLKVFRRVRDEIEARIVNLQVSSLISIHKA